MKIARMFVKPDGRVCVDIPLAEGQDMNQVVMMARTDGVLYNAFNAIPWDSILWATTIDVPDNQMASAKVVPFNLKTDPPKGAA